ncbi:MAG: DUF559 domain-containing protein [Myxococcales bacterium]|nr:DUF559 domain-containing protein [Myxococcales bacterium]
MPARSNPSAHRRSLLAERARVMRNQMTSGEALLWSRLAGSQLGVPFRRQVPLAGRFIADFFAPSARLVVEVDGAYHQLRSAADARRDRVLARLGIRVLRVDDSLVRSNLDAALALVRDALAHNP